MARKSPENKNQALASEEAAFHRAYSRLTPQQKTKLVGEIFEDPTFVENNFSLNNLKILAEKMGVQAQVLEAELSGIDEVQSRIKIIKFLAGQKKADEMAEEMTIVQGMKGHLKNLLG